MKSLIIVDRDKKTYIPFNKVKTISLDINKIVVSVGNEKIIIVGDDIQESNILHEYNETSIIKFMNSDESFTLKIEKENGVAVAMLVVV